MDIITLISLFGIVGLLGERIFKSIRKSRCKHILCKCCGSQLELDRELENTQEIK